MEIVTYAILKPSSNEDLTEATQNSDLIYRGILENESQLPKTASIGDVYKLQSTGINYLWDGKTWKSLPGALIPPAEATDQRGTTLKIVNGEWVKALPESEEESELPVVGPQDVGKILTIDRFLAPVWSDITALKYNGIQLIDEEGGEWMLSVNKEGRLKTTKL